MTLRVNEIFYSIQGESSYAGRACIFVRLTGCNLRCSYCDTAYAYDEGDDLETGEIIDRVGSYKCRLVEITGGEPLIQAETPSLIQALIKQGYKVLLETNGSQDISKVHADCVRILDIKCPSSGEEKNNDLENLSRLRDRDEIKFVIGDREDYNYAVTLLHQANHKAIKGNRVFFSPVFGKMAPRTLARWILEDHIDVNLHLQLHKLIWGHEKRGV